MVPRKGDGVRPAGLATAEPSLGLMTPDNRIEGSPMIDAFFVLLGGGLGSACRYLVSTAAGKAFGNAFAWGTMIVNLLGCLLIGFVVGLADRALVSRAFRLMIVTGFLGGFTTLSTFSLDSVRMLLAGEYAKGLANIGANVAGGMALVLLGLYASSALGSR